MNAKPIIVILQEEQQPTDLVHYKYDGTLSRCAIALMDFINERTARNIYTTTKDINNFPGYGGQAKSTAKKLLEAGGYITFDLLRRKNKGWRSVKTHRKASEIPEKERSPYFNLPSQNKNGGYTYVFKRIRDGLYKIGVTENLRSRAPGIAASCGSHLKFITAIDIAEYIAVEIELHNYFEHKRTVGEWFELDEQDIDKIHRFFAELENARF